MACFAVIVLSKLNRSGAATAVASSLLLLGTGTVASGFAAVSGVLVSSSLTVPDANFAAAAVVAVAGSAVISSLPGSSGADAVAAVDGSESVDNTLPSVSLVGGIIRSIEKTTETDMWMMTEHNPC